MEAVNTTGAVVAVLIYTLTSLVFVARLAGSQRVEQGLGLCVVAMIAPLVYLLLVSRGGERPALYFVQLGLMIVYLVVELLLDYILKVDFRSVRWMTITYVTLFFAGTGGMLGVASLAGSGWMYLSIVLFLAMTALAFVQRAVTGM